MNLLEFIGFGENKFAHIKNIYIERSIRFNEWMVFWSVHMLFAFLSHSWIASSKSKLCISLSQSSWKNINHHVKRQTWRKPRPAPSRCLHRSGQARHITWRHIQVIKLSLKFIKLVNKTSCRSISHRPMQRLIRVGSNHMKHYLSSVDRTD